MSDSEGVEKGRRDDEEDAEMKVDVDVGVFVEGADPEESVGPDEHDSNECEAVETEVVGVQTDVVAELCFDLIVGVDDFNHEFVVYGAGDPEDSCQKAVELRLVDSDSVFEVVDDEDEDGCKEADSMYYG